MKKDREMKTEELQSGGKGQGMDARTAAHGICTRYGCRVQVQA